MSGLNPCWEQEDCIAELEADLAKSIALFDEMTEIARKAEAERDLAKFNEAEYRARLKRADEDVLKTRESAQMALAVGSEWMTRCEQAEAELAALKGHLFDEHACDCDGWAERGTE